MEKTENHITDFSEEIDTQLSIALGEMVIAFGRLEDMLKISINRIQTPSTPIKNAIEKFNKDKGTIGKIKKYCEDNNLDIILNYSQEIEQCNEQRQNFIHATYAESDNGQYIRFRKLQAYEDLASDIVKMKEITEKVYELIRKLNTATRTTTAHS